MILLRIDTNKLYKHSANIIHYDIECKHFYVDNDLKTIYIDNQVFELNVINTIYIKINGLFHTIYNKNCKVYSSNVDKYNNNIKEFYTIDNIKEFYDMFD